MAVLQALLRGQHCGDLQLECMHLRGTLCASAVVFICCRASDTHDCKLTRDEQAQEQASQSLSQEVRARVRAARLSFRHSALSASQWGQATSGCGSRSYIGWCVRHNVGLPGKQVTCLIP